jgi:hypothetical protein
MFNIKKYLFIFNQYEYLHKPYTRQCAKKNNA